MKKFVNLSSNYKNFLNNCSNIFNNVNLTDELELDELNNYKSQVESLLINYDMQISDINNLIENYDKKNDQIINFKKLIYIRNYNLLQLVLRSDQWKNFIIKLKNKCIEKTEKNISNKQIEHIFIGLLEKYIGSWNTLDKFIIFNKKNNIKDIEIIDPEDYNYIFLQL